ncbi:MAG TPA: hypothetical protein VF761_13680 [Gemmatimonadaceae bacterium]
MRALAFVTLASVLLFACHSTRPDLELPPGYGSERGIDRAAVLLSDWTPTRPQHCAVAKLPGVLPDVDSLIVRDVVPPMLEQGGIAALRGSALLSLKFDAAGAVTRVRVIETTLPASAVPVIEQIVLSALRPQPALGAAGVRLRIELDSVPRYRVGRAERCMPAYLPTTGPSATLRAAPPGRATQRQVDKRTQGIRFSITVGTDGRVLEARQLDHIGDSFSDIATQVISAARFVPGRDDGVVVPMTIERVQKVTVVAVMDTR